MNHGNRGEGVTSLSSHIPLIMRLMYQCSLCTAAECVKPKSDDELCAKCGDVHVHICDRCADGGEQAPVTCYICTKRPHICLSRCLRGCVMKPVVMCTACNERARRRQVLKEGPNQGRFFYTCCGDFFEWE